MFALVAQFKGAYTCSDTCILNAAAAMSALADNVPLPNHRMRIGFHYYLLKLALLLYKIIASVMLLQFIYFSALLLKSYIHAISKLL